MNGNNFREVIIFLAEKNAKAPHFFSAIPMFFITKANNVHHLGVLFKSFDI